MAVQTDACDDETSSNIPDELQKTIGSHLWLANLETSAGTPPDVRLKPQVPRHPQSNVSRDDSHDLKLHSRWHCDGAVWLKVQGKKARATVRLGYSLTPCATRPHPLKWTTQVMSRQGKEPESQIVLKRPRQEDRLAQHSTTRTVPLSITPSIHGIDLIPAICGSRIICLIG